MTLRAEKKEERKRQLPEQRQKNQDACMLGAKGHGERMGLTLGLWHNV